jgi:hypothetical protein
MWEAAQIFPAASDKAFIRKSLWDGSFCAKPDLYAASGGS